MGRVRILREGYLTANLHYGRLFMNGNALGIWLGAACATAGAATLTGKVILPDGTAVPGITVVQKSTGLSAVTDAAGTYLLGTTTGIGSGAGKASMAMAGRKVSVVLEEPTAVSLTVRDVRGQILSSQERLLGTGRWDLDATRGLRARGMMLVEVRAAGERRVFPVFHGGEEGNAQAAGGMALGLARAEAAADTLTLKDGTTTIGKVGIASATGTAADVKIVRRSVTGRIPGGDTALAASKGAVKLWLVPSTGAAQTVTAAYDPTAKTYAATLPWKIYQAGLTWKAMATGYDASGAVIGTSPRLAFTDSVKAVALDTFSVIPDALKPSVDWVWPNRMKNTAQANALNFHNSVFDQILAEGGKLNYGVRWESTTRITKAQRVKFEPMLNRAVASWVKSLKGYDAFPYDTVPVKIVGWAVSSLDYLDTTGLTVPVYVNGGLEANGAAAPKAPVACDRDNFHDQGPVSTTYPDCKSPDQHFDMSLWGTDGMNGGAGGDWGQRVGSAYILSVLDAAEPHIIEHEIGHGFLLPDFYETADLPPTGLPTAIMRAGASAVVTPWDGWMLRRAWSELKAQGRWTLP